ncbi:carbamate kinase [Geobacter hydrogenophilus]|uniref:Carbamate kinase n=1 Tax=Geobacter hydrogenophilus TaxID=40983 RepID=A0A9W6FYP9_9BACT|nr:carbamate kinase [Geobacter hydrogenophilus]MBT0894539.1 carbamate kinase [Geobacter hydrogenophilus]GLI37267.1 carbamate kinase [Geobacter hydrogenophilus]
MTRNASRPILLIALGGNALIRQGERGTCAEQFANLRRPMEQIARLADRYLIIITHGNGPQVGNLLMQQESCPEVPAMPLEVLVAQTQGQIGYMIESTLESELLALGGEKRFLVSLVSYVQVAEDDPAFRTPTKPIGPSYTAEDAARFPWPMVSTPRGYRRVVASPEPLTVVEKEEIRRLVEMDFIVVCCGGGGIPVTREGRAFHGIDAVIDKDLASACLCLEVGVDILVIATDVPGVATGFGTTAEEFLKRLDADEAERLLAAGQFPPGSMGPKVEAVLRFVCGGGKRGVICHLDEIEQAVAGTAGTEITRGTP